MNASAMARGGRAQAERAARGSVTKGAARAGLTARGVIYLLVGLLALQIAFGEDKSQEADRQGALAEISQRPFGSVLLWALGIGLVGMALWRLSEVVFGSVGPEGRKPKKRLMALARCAFYSFVAYSVLAFAAGSGSGGGSSDEQSRDVTARVLELPGGQWIVGAGGIGIVVAGLWIGGRAVLRKYRDKMRMGQMSPAVRRAVDVTGVGGGAARGLVFAAAGVFAVRAAVDYRPDQAKGLDDTLRSFADTPAGPWLLACVAAGLVLFGLFSFAMARWRKV
ncbi:DUF1206 domain-containing protein [Streptomyces sp. NPDC002553]|uniref:DUF1206 domain-containing protein n=1 Tax=Streptomyces sp. NPDC002553 TaxID=3154417 RepID=UPI003328AFDB